MSLFVLGINHKSASIKLREKLAFDGEELEGALKSLRSLAGVHEAVILSTCNRTELYCVADSDCHSEILSWMGEFHALPLMDYSSKAYQYADTAAVRHTIEVACGLDSMVLGEPEILGQIKTAFSRAQQAKTVGPELSRLFQHVFAAAKQIRTETEIGAHSISLAYVSLTLAKRIFSDISSLKVLLIGAGEMIELVAKHFYENGIEQIVVVNRTLEKADAIAQNINGRGAELNQLNHYLPEADIVLSSTASPVPVLGKGVVESAIKQRKHRPMLMVDLAVPRDVEPEVSQLPDIYLYTVDDLQSVIDENLKSRKSASHDADKIIDRRTAEFLSLSKERMAVGTLKAYRSKVESVRNAEIEKAKKALEKGEDVSAVLERFSQDLSNKLMHEPSIALKRAGSEERLDLLAWAKELFGLSANEVDDLDNYRKSNKDSLIDAAKNQDKAGD